VTAIERLALSRECLRAALLPPPDKAPSHLPGASISEFATSLLERIKAMPGLAGLIEPVEAWWAQHPLRTASLIVAEGSRKLAAPVADRHPLALVLAAALAGALLVLSRPWRWLVSPAVVAGLLPSLASRTLRNLPLGSWVRVLASISAPAISGRPPVPGNRPRGG